MMNQCAELQLAKDGVFLNLGKNVFLFQQVEVMLKLILSSSLINKLILFIDCSESLNLSQQIKMDLVVIVAHNFQIRE